MNWKNGKLMGLMMALTLSINAQNEIPLPTPPQLQWQNAELAALVCWDVHAHDRKFYRQHEARITPVEDYNIFDPQQYDTDQWIKTLKEAGFKVAILTVSHETGFFMHQSDATPFCMKALKWRDGKGDVLRDFKASCEKYGILPGVYISTRWNAFYGIHDFKVHGTGAFAQNRQEHYNRMVEKIVEEIFSGSCIGHKFIHRFNPVEASELRLIISKAKGEPQIQNFTVYHVEKNH